jgi:hypothetical protein
MMSLSQTEALRIFNERYRTPTLKILAVGDTDVPNAWYIRFSLEDRPMMIRPSRLVCISKADGQILFDGDAGDEG